MMEQLGVVMMCVGAVLVGLPVLGVLLYGFWDMVTDDDPVGKIIAAVGVGIILVGVGLSLQ